ncbi:unnamed protein product [Peronospora destructor]|uniref:beta-glucosidase n=1 Tax=Peronospora destructor TaxID=86335 RepID=A0AAV0V080_9STRA|nr:unnamed protein product [Peronospora destructor]
MLKSWLTATFLPGVVIALTSGENEALDAQAQEIVDGFSVAEVIGQMTQLDLSTVINVDTHELNEDAVRTFAKMNVGSYLNTFLDSQSVDGNYGYDATGFRSLIHRIQEITMEENGGHPILYGIDSIHGASYVTGAMLFPQQINCELIMGSHYETFGEDPYLCSVMRESYVRGLQSLNQTAACIKHFIGYSKTPTGHDRDNVRISDFDLLNNFLPPFKAALDAGALTMMENYVSLNGEPVIASSKILNDLLRSDLEFNGVLVSDWNEIYNLHDFHRVSATREEAVATSLKQTSIDISMVPLDTAFIEYGLNMLMKNPEQEARLRKSVKRVIRLKLELGLYDNPVPGKEYVSMVGNDKDKEAALKMARESIVLLKNEGDVLPLPKTASVFLTGHSSDNVGYQCGGWTLTWQGYSGNAMFPHGVSVRKGMENLVGNDSFTYYNGLRVNGSIADVDLAKAVKLAGQHKYTIAAIGEPNYTEKPGDIDDPALPEGQERFIEALVATGTKVIVVLFEGRPRLLGSIPDNAAAIIDGMLPCKLGGQAIAEIIYGNVNPSGKLPITYPKDSANIAIPYNHLVTTRCMYDNCRMQWDFGAGLSYTKFNYASVTLDKTTITNADETLTATVTVTNAGSCAGKETVMLFLIQPFRKISVPEMKMLKKFKKIELQAGESMVVSFSLSSKDWGVFMPEIGSGLKRVVEDSNYVVAIKPDTWCNAYGNMTNPLCASFTIDMAKDAGTVNTVTQE